MKKVSVIFLSAFIFNLVWENLHSFLYAGYKGGTISEFILLRATLGDAVIISIIALPFIFLPSFKRQSWLIIPIGLVIAISIEWFALGAGRWAYNELMPIIPLINTGITPTIQLAILSYMSYKLQEYIFSRHSFSQIQS